MLLDSLDRPARSLRISVTDRCNLRCQYCMPEAHYTWLPRPDILRVDELDRLARVFTRVGVDRVRLTGGEPLLRPDLPNLVERLAQNPRIRDLAMTTNGVLLAGQAARLRAAGLHRITVSLDTLRPARFEALTRFAQHAAVLRGIDDAAATAFASLKLDTVVIRGINEDELVDLLEFARSRRDEIRFAENTSAPADRFRLPDGTIFGIISSTTTPFCRSCDRSRLTADGVWLLCLYATQGTDLRSPLRRGASDPVGALKIDPHLEMHTRGG